MKTACVTWRRYENKIKMLNTFPLRSEFCEMVPSWFVHRRRRPPLTPFSEIAQFHISERVKCQNNRFWPAKNLVLFLEGPLFDVMGCCDMSAGILGPFIFLTVCIHTNISLIIWRNLLNNYPMWGNLSFSFQQSIVLTHTANNSVRCLYSGFENKMISRGMCSPRSSVLNLCCQFLRVGYVSG